MVAAVKFTRKTLPQKEGLGEKLAKKRIATGLDLKDVEKAIRIRAKYIESIENGKYESLPPDVYVRGFVRNYAAFLKLDPDKVMKLYLRERGLAENVRKAGKPAPTMKQIEVPKLVITPKTITYGIIVAVVVLIVSYIGWQVSILTAPPQLSVTGPRDNITIDGNSTLVEGKTDSGANLFINDVEVGIDQDGTFKEKINLQNGVNIIKVKSQNKLGKYNEIDRTVVAKLSESAQVASVGTIELKLVVGPKSASIQVEVDGKKVTDKAIVVLAGVTQTYKAASSIKVTTSDGGSVQATYNNQNVGALGKNGEAVTREFTSGMKVQ